MAMAVASGVGVGGVRAVREWDPLRYWLPVLLFLLSVADAFPWIVCLSQTLWACPFHVCVMPWPSAGSSPEGPLHLPPPPPPASPPSSPAQRCSLQTDLTMSPNSLVT